MEKREQVFVSSTYVDLKEERQEVIQTLLEADCIPSGMELFPASDDDQWTLIKRVIDDCDYYLVVVGGRYGSINQEHDISYTEMEFDYAITQKKPVLAFLHGDPGTIPAAKSELGDEARKKLEVFREKVSQRMVKYWTSPKDLGGQVAKSLIQIRKTHPAEGWVRASNALTPEVERELAELRARVAELSAELADEHRQVVANIAELAQGDDEFKLELIVDYYPQELVEAGTDRGSGRQRGRGKFATTWNAVFGRLAPVMLDEATEEVLNEHLNEFGLIIAREDDAKREPDEKIGRIMDAEVLSDSFNDVKVQLFALGLMERSERRHAVSDTSTYWKLTPNGRDQLMRIRAIIRKSADDGDTADTDNKAKNEGH